MTPEEMHELLDRSQVVADIFSEHVSAHQAADHPKLRKLIDKIERDLYILYNKIADLT